MRDLYIDVIVVWAFPCAALSMAINLLPIPSRTSPGKAFELHVACILYSCEKFATFSSALMEKVQLGHAQIAYSSMNYGWMCIKN